MGGCGQEALLWVADRQDHMIRRSDILQHTCTCEPNSRHLTLAPASTWLLFDCLVLILLCCLLCCFALRILLLLGHLGGVTGLQSFQLELELVPFKN